MIKMIDVMRHARPLLAWIYDLRQYQDRAARAHQIAKLAAELYVRRWPRERADAATAWKEAARFYQEAPVPPPLPPLPDLAALVDAIISEKVTAHDAN